jgi:TonB family protein
MKKTAALGVVLAFTMGSVALRAQEVIVNPPLAFPGQEAFDRVPVVKGRLAPEFPREMKASSEIGYATVIVSLDEKGKNRARWVEATVHPYRNVMDEELTHWKVQPAERGGQPVGSRIWFSVIFNPASSSEKLPDATPRLLELSPIFHPDKKAGKTTTVPVNLVVNEQGRAERITVGSAYQALQGPIQEAVAGWKFSPARKGGQPVVAELTLPVVVQAQVASEIAKGTPPVPIRQMQPEYPKAMVYSGLRGEVTVEFVIDAEGKVEDAKVLESNNPGFNDAALEAVRQWKFKPARMGEKPVSTRVKQLIEFQLFGGRDAYSIEKAKPAKGARPSVYEPDVLPKPRGVKLPVYPYELLRNRTRGSAEVRMIIDERGRVYEVVVLKSTHPEFGLALAAAVQAYSFDPALKEGKPVASALQIKQEFDSYDSVDPDTQDLLETEIRHPEKILSAKTRAELPKAISRPGPAYPPEKERAGKEGRAVVEFLIDRDGRVRLPRIVSATDPSFGYAAVQAAATWQFEKPLINGKSAVLRIRMPMEFEIAGK